MRQLLAPFTLLIALQLAACYNLPTTTEVPAVPFPPLMSASVVRPEAPIPPAPSETLRRVPETWTATSTAPPPTFTPNSTRIPLHDLAALNEYQRGVAYTALQSGAYRSRDSDHSLDLLLATGANYISLLVTWYQNDWRSTQVRRTEDTPSDEDLSHVIEYAHKHGVHIMLKPQIDFTDDPVHWRGQISFADASLWQAWFDSYRQFILHYARFAQRNGVEEFSVGTELETASTQTEQWRAIIRSVRAEYTGLLTYSANHSGEEVAVEFWDDLDFIGVSNFYHLTNYRSPTIGQLMEGWEGPIARLQRVHERFPIQPIIFTEVGYPSLERANVWPWNWYRIAKIDLEGQARCYEALFRVWWKNPNRPWFRGLFIWNWLTTPNQGGAHNGDYTPHRKPAENVLKAWFSESPESSPYSSIATPRP